ncbi:MAG TPA: hypothetical protein VLC07_03105 [Solirubrobacterales bacterium]|nr:hypothetical protein [Solirubrobacterales bacterium]
MKLGLTLGLLILLAAGCGGGGDQAGSAQGKERKIAWNLYPPGPTREFIVPFGDNIVQEFGREATTAEREQASRTIAAWMRARADQDWRRDCSYFSRAYVHSLITTDAMKVSEGKVKNCAQGLAYFGHAASGSYNNNLSGPIDSLRVGKGQGYAQYHGNDGHDWIIPMGREGGKWWVATATPINRMH